MDVVVLNETSKFSYVLHLLFLCNNKNVNNYTYVHTCYISLVSNED